MKRTVKAWGIVRNGDWTDKALVAVEFTREAARQTMIDYFSSVYYEVGDHSVTRCAVTYDDGKPARRKGRAKR